MNSSNKATISPWIVKSAGILGASGVILGAFGAHALRDRLAHSGFMDAWQTAVQYQLVHALALLALGLTTLALGTGLPARSRGWCQGAARCWTLGVAFFSGSLYLLALGGPRWLGPVTPLGGLLLIAGWILVTVAAWRWEARA